MITYPVVGLLLLLLLLVGLEVEVGVKVGDVVVCVFLDQHCGRSHFDKRSM